MLVARGCEGTLLASSVFFPAVLPRSWSGPAEAGPGSSGMWQRDPGPGMPHLTGPRPHPRPRASFRTGLWSPRCTLCLTGSPPYSTKRLFSSLGREAILSSRDC